MGEGGRGWRGGTLVLCPRASESVRVGPGQIHLAVRQHRQLPGPPPGSQPPAAPGNRYSPRRPRPASPRRPPPPPAPHTRHPNPHLAPAGPRASLLLRRLPARPHIGPPSERIPLSVRRRRAGARVRWPNLQCSDGGGACPRALAGRAWRLSGWAPDGGWRRPCRTRGDPAGRRGRRGGIAADWRRPLRGTVGRGVRRMGGERGYFLEGMRVAGCWREAWRGVHAQGSRRAESSRGWGGRVCGHESGKEGEEKRVE
jgi:hypothetical protein